MFIQRLISGIILVIFIFSFFYLGGFALAAMLVFTSLVGYNELCKAMKIEFKDRITGYIITAAMYVGMYFVTDYMVVVVASFVYVLAMLSDYVIRYPKVNIEQLGAKMIAFFYAPLLFTFVYFTRESSIGLQMIWIILLASWVCDTFAYCTGMLFGKKKIFPVLSPKKSLEGCIGGVVASGIAGFLYSFFYLTRYMPGMTVVIITTVGCMLCSVFSMIGDLAASGIKRQTGIKDYGNLIPGHGGIMDRFDSVLFVAPICFIITKILEIVVG